MTINEAIHNLQLHLDGNPQLHDIKLRQSMHLSIEALKWRRDCTISVLPGKYRPLPGETQD